MYCKQCGNQISEGSLFCDKCGARVEVTEMNINETEIKETMAEEKTVPTVETNEVVQEETNKADNDFIVSVIKLLKGFFSTKTVQTVQTAAKSSGLEWIVFMGVSALMCAFAVALNAKSFIKGIVGALTSGIYGAASGLLSNNIVGSAVGSVANPILNSVGDTVASSLFNFAVWFVGGLILGAGTYFVVSSLLYCGMKLIMRVQCRMQCVFNMVAVATFPMTLAFTLNIILGFIWLPLVIVSFVVGIVASVILLYAGMQKLEKIDKSPYWTYVLVMAVVILVVVIIAAIVIAIALAGMASQISNLASGLGDLF